MDSELTRRRAESMLRKLGMSGAYKGFRYAIEEIAYYTEHYEEFPKISMGQLHEVTATVFGTTPQCVERNMRTLVERHWDKGFQASYEALTGTVANDIPWLSDFVDALSYVLRQNTDA